jgi:hypothetical protein
VGKDLMGKVWQEADLRPPRRERHQAREDPEFECRAEDILYPASSQHAAVFGVDEKSAIQALDRTDRCLPRSPGRVEKHGFESYRHATLSL